jgi:UV DNA damage endonuclease
MAKKKIRKDQEKPGKVRLGLCCIFRDEPIRFRTTTAKYLLRFDRREQLRKISGLCLQNSQSLLEALRFLQHKGIGAFRISSPFFPRYTHPAVGYPPESRGGKYIPAAA